MKTVTKKRVAKKVKDPYQDEWNNIEVPTTKELGMEYGESKSYVSVAVLVAIFLGALVGMISITPTIIEACKV